MGDNGRTHSKISTAVAWTVSTLFKYRVKLPNDDEQVSVYLA